MATTDDSRRRSVLLLKAADAKYADTFSAAESPAEGASFDVHFADVLTFEYVNADALRDVLLRLNDYRALLVTSPRAGIAIRNVVESLSDGAQKEQVHAALKAIAVFSVGKATSRELECFGVQCQGDDCGSADVMAEFIHQEGILPISVSSKPVLFLCGDKRRDTLPDSFTERHLTLEELRVYQTCPVANFQLPEECQKPDWIVYFSPSGIKATRKLAFSWATIKKAAIGKTTETALKHVAEETGDATWVADVVAPKPNAESLAQAIADYERAAGVSR